jgi:hypothetical protein
MKFGGPQGDGNSLGSREVIGGLSACLRARLSNTCGQGRIESAATATAQWWGRRFRLPGQAESQPHQRRSRSGNGSLRVRQLRLLAGAVLLLALSSCGRYADFTLPVLPGGAAVTYAFEEHAEPVLPRGGARDVLNPSVAGPDMYYSAWDGRTWRTARAHSEDGLRWRPQGVVLAPDPATWEGDYIAANGSALLHKGQTWYWYQAGPRGNPRIGLARDWRKEPRPVLEPGPWSSWDEMAVADPCAIFVEPWFYLYYLGQDRARRQRLGVARSRDGAHWQKLRSNPILELGDPGAFDESGLGEPAVWSSHGFYWMLYTGRDAAENRRLGLARSTDGVRWQKMPAVFAGRSAWDSKVICDPSVEVDGAEVRVWFGGGDVARPDENLNGQIGYGILRPLNATLGK